MSEPHFRILVEWYSGDESENLAHESVVCGRPTAELLAYQAKKSIERLLEELAVRGRVS